MAHPSGQDPPKTPPPGEEHVDERAKAFVEGGEEGHDHGDEDTARTAAERILEDSEQRMFDPATNDPENDDVIRRSSDETASIGDTGPMRQVGDGSKDKN